MPYSQVKVYSDGSHYIGIPYIPDPRARNCRPRYEEVIEVKEQSEEAAAPEEETVAVEQNPANAAQELYGIYLSDCPFLVYEEAGV